jgi:hypothetical protein
VVLSSACGRMQSFAVRRMSRVAPDEGLAVPIFGIGGFQALVRLGSRLPRRAWTDHRGSSRPTDRSIVARLDNLRECIACIAAVCCLKTRTHQQRESLHRRAAAGRRARIVDYELSRPA